MDRARRFSSASSSVSLTSSFSASRDRVEEEVLLHAADGHRAGLLAELVPVDLRLLQVHPLAGEEAGVLLERGVDLGRRPSTPGRRPGSGRGAPSRTARRRFSFSACSFSRSRLFGELGLQHLEPGPLGRLALARRQDLAGELVVELGQDPLLEGVELRRGRGRSCRRTPGPTPSAGKSFWKLTVTPASAFRRWADISGSVSSPPISTRTFGLSKSLPSPPGKVPWMSTRAKSPSIAGRPSTASNVARPSRIRSRTAATSSSVGVAELGRDLQAAVVLRLDGRPVLDLDLEGERGVDLELQVVDLRLPDGDDPLLAERLVERLAEEATRGPRSSARRRSASSRSRAGPFPGGSPGGRTCLARVLAAFSVASRTSSRGISSDSDFFVGDSST